MKAPDRAPARAVPDDPLAEIEAMILRLSELRQREPAKERKADYQAAIDRLHALAYRLTEAGRSRTVGRAAMPARVPKAPAPVPVAPAPKAAAKAPQPALPLGPVIVRAKKLALRAP